jgi:regulator of replication initiation timing
MIYAANVRGRALILVLESTGLRVGDVTKFLRKDIEPLLDKEPPVDLEICTEKERIQAHTFLHAAAVKAIKEYLASRTDDYPWLFPTANGKSLMVREVDTIIKTAFKNANFDSGNLRIRTHCLRKFTIGRLQDAGVETNLWKVIVGKKSLEAAYNSNKLREAYITALPKLDPSSLNNNHLKLTDLESKVGSLEKENTQLRLELNELKTKKTLELLMSLFDKEKKKVLEEAFKKSVPVSAVNGKKVTVEPVRIDAGEIVALKALAKVFLELSNEEKT